MLKEKKIIFEKRLPYFYYPKTNELKKSNHITSKYLKQNNSDSDLISCLFYYWALGNNQSFGMYNEAKKDESVSKTINDEVVILGVGVDIETISSKCGTIANEIFVGFNRRIIKKAVNF